MTTSNVAVSLVVVGLAASLIPRLPARVAVPPIRVGPNVQVSESHELDVHYEVIACAAPDTSRLVVGSVIYSAHGITAGTIVYSSANGGLTWTPTLAGRELENTGDPACAYGPDGSAYYTASLIPPAGDRTMQIYRSRDGGTVWDQHSSLTYTDREYVTVDATSGPFRGRVYVNGNNRVPRTVADFVMFASSDSGRTFRGPAKRAAFGQTQTPFMGNAVVASDGTLIGVFGEVQRGATQTVLAAITSRDGGETLTPALPIAQVEIGGNRKGAHNNVNSEPILAIDATRGRFRDRLYVVWPDRRSGHSQIFFASSADLGKSWSAARAMNDNSPRDSTDQFMPAVAVNREGIVGVLWYDRRDHPDNVGWDARFSASLDGGDTWLSSVKVSERGTTFGPTTPWTAARASVTFGRGQVVMSVSLNSFMFLGGDTDGLVADGDGVFHPVWVDNRTGTPQVWTAPVTVDRTQVGERARPKFLPELRARTPPAPVAPRVIPPAVAEVAKIQPPAPTTPRQPRVPAAVTEAILSITDDVRLVVTATDYDRRADVLSVTAHLENTSSATHAGPFRLRAIGLQSELGDPAVVNPDGGSASNPEWTFREATLAPNAVSEPKVLRFSLARIRPFRDGHRYRTGLIELTAVVLGGDRRR